jgi:hypothetical protein
MALWVHGRRDFEVVRKSHDAGINEIPRRYGLIRTTSFVLIMGAEFLEDSSSSSI